MSISESAATKSPHARDSGFFARLSRCLAENPNAVIALFGGYFLLQIIIRQIVPPALRVDEAQQVLFSQWLALGYDAQPPLYNWYQQAVFGLFGTSMATIALAKNFVLFLIFAVYTKIAEMVLKDKRLVVVAAFSLFVIPQVFWQAQRDLTHTAMLMLTFAGMLYFSIRLIQRPSTFGYVLVGLMAGLGMLSKYNFALVLPALLFAVWLHPQGRERIMDRRFFLTVIASLTPFVPHLFWLIDNLGFASEVTLKRMAEDAPENRLLQVARGIGRFFTGAAIICMPAAILLFLSGWRKFRRSGRPEAVWQTFFLHYFLAVTVLMISVILMTTMTEMRDRWLLPLLLPFPIFAALFLENRLSDVDGFVAKFLPVPLIMMILVPVALLASQPLMASIGRTSNSNYDWSAFRDHILDKQDIAPSLIVTPDWPSGGNLRYVFPDISVATTIYDDYDPAFKISQEHPALLVWIGDGNNLPQLKSWLEGQIDAKLRDVTYTSLQIPTYYPIKDKPIRFNYAIIRPTDISPVQ